MSDSHILLIREYLLLLQDKFCTALETEEPEKKFIEDNWQHEQGGGGRTRVIEEGRVFERGGVNFSHVSGLTLPPAATLQRPDLTGVPFQALGISIVIHPRNPYVPTMHANLRFFQAQQVAEQKSSWWFGGGFDLTPYYGFHEDCIHWHKTAKAACDPYGVHLYPQFKKQCDDYFYLKHRHEARGIGGIFFDNLQLQDFANTFSFVKNVGDHLLLAYLPIVQRRKHMAYAERERDFQTYRRGRYVEFNLIQDRGTLFGLQSGGRTESILVSLPPQVSWRYHWQPEAGTPEAQLYNEFLPPRDWAVLA